MRMSYLQGRTRFWDEALFLGFLSNKRCGARHILLSFFLCPDVQLVWNLRTLFILGSFNAQTGIKLHCYEIRPLILAASKLWQIWTLNEMNCVIWVKIKSERKGMLCWAERWGWGGTELSDFPLVSSSASLFPSPPGVQGYFASKYRNRN